MTLQGAEEAHGTYHGHTEMTLHLPTVHWKRLSQSGEVSTSCLGKGSALELVVSAPQLHSEEVGMGGGIKGRPESRWAERSL